MGEVLCTGVLKRHKTLSIHISPDGNYGAHNCLRASCLYAGYMKSISSQAKLNSREVQGDWHETQSAEEVSADVRGHARFKRPVFNPSKPSEAAKTDGYETQSVQKVSADVGGFMRLKEAFSSMSEPCEEVLDYFESRKISRKTVARNQVKETFSKTHGAVIVFPYLLNGEVVNFKYRTLGKMFWQEKQSLKVFYGLDDITNAKEIIIVEGEMDKLAMEEAGFLNCISVPDGAPAKISAAKRSISEAEDKKYSYIWNCKEYFEKVSRIIIATDGDDPGQALAEELARRLGRERCWRVQWPMRENGKKAYKDANEVLVELGVGALQAVVHNAELYPIRGLFTFADFFKDLDHYYRVQGGDEVGISTGWRCLDNFYKVVPGELTLVTGVPGSGKSEWIDALAVNLAESKGWTFGLCSMENKVREHARKLIEKHWKKPFFDASYAGGRQRMSPQELELGKQWINDYFYLIRCEDDELPSVDWVLKLARAAVMRHGIRGLVIDPYNELDHQRSSHQTETEYVSKMLTKIKRFAQHHGCHVWFVAHPRQLQSWSGEAPSLYDVSGSAHFINKCDNGIIIHRNRDSSKGSLDQVEVLVRKARNKVSGALGGAYLIYDRVTGLYSDREITMLHHPKRPQRSMLEGDDDESPVRSTPLW
ncbi:hypothetical protein GOP47_0026570 [Adiantum capillus-veneris]|nr:hypothetical protein GOP47_0026570 [Adiantum capillus-veneris]